MCERDSIEVKAFGVDQYTPTDEIRDNVSVVDYNHEDDFIIKLHSETADEEIILAKILRQETLLDMIQSVQNRIKRSTPSSIKEDELVMIPKCDFKVIHSFDELKGRMFRNPGWRLGYIYKAVQSKEKSMAWPDIKAGYFNQQIERDVIAKGPQSSFSHRDERSGGGRLMR